MRLREYQQRAVDGARQVISLGRGKEVWLPIPGFEKYHVSNFGRVKRVKKTWSHEPKILTPWTESHGYKQVELTDNGVTKTFRVHRLVLSVFVGDAPDDKPEANHKDGKRDNNSIDNLEWVSSRDNMKWSYSQNIRGKLYGEKSHLAKLTNGIVLAIRAEDKTTIRKLAKKYGVSNSCIHSILKRKTWVHI